MKCKRCEQPITDCMNRPISDDRSWPDKLCDGCWEVETRLESYLRHPKCLEFVEAVIKKVGNRPPKAFLYRCLLLIGFILGFLLAMSLFWG